MIKDQIEDGIEAVYAQINNNGLNRKWISVHYYDDNDEGKKFVYCIGAFLRFTSFEKMKEYVIKEGEKRNEVPEDK